MAGRGDDIPVSRIPEDGTFPVGTTQYEKRNIAVEVPIWDQELCIHCGQCAIVCPHSVIRAKTMRQESSKARRWLQIRAGQCARLSRFALHPAILCRGLHRLRRLCRKLPAYSPTMPVRRINMGEKLPILSRSAKNIAFFEKLPGADRTRVNFANVRGVAVP